MSDNPPYILKIALATPLMRVFDYLPHNIDAANWPLGVRVRVPFGKQSRIGVLVGLASTSDVPLHKLKAIHECIDTLPILTPSLLRLMHWAADYYHHPLGDALFTALPTRLRTGKDPLIDTVATTPPPYHFHDSLTLNRDQAAAVDAILLDAYKVSLLEGVTGSGKTLVYMHLINKVLSTGKQALLLVPEIGLTPQTIARFTAQFDCEIACLHSALSLKARAQAWINARIGLARIIIGTRSAIFTPMLNPGIIIIDEEHDASFKQQEGFRYSARDLAVVRARLEDIPLVLGTATPAVETYYNAKRQRFQHLQLPARAGDAKPPTTHIIDIRHQTMVEGISPPLLDAIKNHLAAKAQVLLFVNRRGFAPTLLCHQCGWMATCDHCDARLTLHRTARTLRCHHCGCDYPLIKNCHQCNTPSLAPVGVGTQRLEDALTNAIPTARIQRIDRDSTTRKGELETHLTDFANHNIDILIGTQMLAKGHDFKDLTLVAIIDVDSGLYSSDYRAIERMGQLIIQVAGRAGRAHRAGEVVLQTRNPQNPLLQTLIQGDYKTFIETILNDRHHAKLPPFQHFALIRANATNQNIPLQFLQKVKAKALKLNLSSELLGPIPALMEKRADRFRAQLLISAGSRQHLKALLQPLITWLHQYKHGLGASLRWSVDVDPLDML